MTDIARVEALVEIMVRHGLSSLRVDEVTLERPAALCMPIGKAADSSGAGADDAEIENDPVARLRAMSPDQQDRFLMLEAMR